MSRTSPVSRRSSRSAAAAAGPGGRGLLRPPSPWPSAPSRFVQRYRAGRCNVERFAVRRERYGRARIAAFDNLGGETFALGAEYERHPFMSRDLIQERASVRDESD